MAQEIEVKVKVVTEQAVNNVDALGNAFDQTAKDAQDAQKVFAKAGNGVVVEESIAGLKQLKRELKNVAVGSEEFKKLYNDIDDLEDKLKSAKNTSSDWVDSLEQAGGPLGMLGQGINKAKVATQTLGGAFKAMGIGLIVALVAGLAGAFSENEGAMKRLQPLLDGMSKAFQGVFRVVEPLFNTVVDLALKGLPYLTNGIGAVYSGMMAFFTLLKEDGMGAFKILKGIFTLDTNSIKEGFNQISSSGKKVAESYNESMKKFADGSKELTKGEKEQADKREEDRKAAQEKREESEQKARDKRAEERAKELEKLRAYDEETNKLIGEFTKVKIETETQDYLDEQERLKKQQEETSATIDALDASELAISESKLETKKQQTKEENDLETEKLAVKYKALDDLQTIFGTETAMGRALIVAKQMLMAKELIMEVSKTITFSAQAAARSTVALAEGAAQTAKVGFPQNIPLLIGYAAQAVGIFSAIKGAVSASKASVSMPSMSVPSSGGGIATPSIVQASPSVVAPSGVNQLASTLGQNVPIKAYVVSKDMTSQQSLDRNITDTASIG